MEKIHQMIVARARENNVKFNAAKLQFMQTEVKYLGKIFSQDGVECDPERLRALLEMDAPQGRKELMSRLGMFNYVRDFIPNMSSVIACLRELLKKDVSYQWLETHKEAWEKLKKALGENTKLATFDIRKPLVLQCDSSQSGVGFCLMQEKRPIAFGSKSLNESQ